MQYLTKKWHLIFFTANQGATISVLDPGLRVN